MNSVFSNHDQKISKATELIQSVSDCAVFLDQNSQAYIELTVDGVSWPQLIDDEYFKQWLAHKHYSESGSAVNRSAITDAVLTLKGKAQMENRRVQTFQRAGIFEGKYYLDLGSPERHVIEISRAGWRVIKTSPIPFIRRNNTLPLPMPLPGGQLDLLWDAINIREEDRILVLAFLIDSLRCDTAYPILILEGEQGSAKSTTQKRLKSLIDPSATMLRTAPQKPKELFVAAANDYVLNFDNLSKVDGDLQDALCCISTGGAFADRALYTNNQECVTAIQRPVILSGIANLVNQQDLLDRSLYLELPRIESSKRKTDRELLSEFESARPDILGALLDLFVKTLQLENNMPLSSNLGRMADFELLGRAIGIIEYNQPDRFEKAIKRNRNNALVRGLESCAVYPALTAFLTQNPLGFTGTIAELLLKLTHYKDSDAFNWPRTPKGLSTTLRRQAPALRQLGVSIEFVKRSEKGSIVSIQNMK